MKTKEAIAYFGSASRLAKVLKLTHSAVIQWGDDVPVQRAYELWDLTDGELKPESRFNLYNKDIAKHYHNKAVLDAEWEKNGPK